MARPPWGATLILIAAANAVAQPINTCGRLVMGVPCVLFEADAGGRFVLDPPAAGFQVGDRVRVSGDLDPGCVSFCLQSTGCIRGAAAVACSPPTCRPDFDGSGSLGVQDIFAFLAAFFGGGLGPSPPSGDFDGNGQLTVQDIFDFLAAYFIGC